MIAAVIADAVPDVAAAGVSGVVTHIIARAISGVMMARWDLLSRFPFSNRADAEAVAWK